MLLLAMIVMPLLFRELPSFVEKVQYIRFLVPVSLHTCERKYLQLVIDNVTYCYLHDTALKSDYKYFVKCYNKSSKHDSNDTEKI